MTQAQWRIEREYREMPGLSLTEAQTRRLLGLPRDLCEAALKGLARHGFLVETANGTFLRQNFTPAASGVLTPAVHSLMVTRRWTSAGL